MNRQRRPSVKPHRSGITLMEVLLSTAIFMGSLTAILGIIQMGHESRLSSRLDAEAALRCESLMGEYIAGVAPLTAESNAPFEDSDEWRYTTSIEDADGESLLKVVVLVQHMAGERVNSYAILTRLMRDPQLFLDAAMETEAAE